MKHCLTNSKHRHIGAKRSVLWPSKYTKMRFWLGLCWPSSWLSLGALVGRGDILPHAHPPRRSSLPPSVLAACCLDILDAIDPDIFSLKPCLAAWWRWAPLTPPYKQKRVWAISPSWKTLAMSHTMGRSGPRMVNLAVTIHQSHRHRQYTPLSVRLKVVYEVPTLHKIRARTILGNWNDRLSCQRNN